MRDGIESLNPEPGRGEDWADGEAGRRTRERVEARLDGAEAGLQALPGARRSSGWLIALPAVAVLLAVGLPLLLLRGGGPGDVMASTTSTEPASSTSTTPPATTTALPRVAAVYEFNGMVLDKQGVGPHLCLVVEESLPPQCEGTPLSGLDWADVPWAETAGDTTWAEARVVGTFDGETFTLTQAPEPLEAGPVPGEGDDPFASPCPEPEGGLVVTDPALATEGDFENARAYAEAQPDYAGLWVDQLGRPGEGDFDPASFVLNVRFTGGLEAHEADLQAVYGGPLCVSGAARSQAELEAALAQLPVLLGSPEAEAAGIYGAAGFGIDTMRGLVYVEAFAVTGDGQAWLDDRFGPGVVEVHGALTALEVP
jgi:hypothetical protein